MSEDLSDMIKNVKNMIDSGNMPDNIKEMLGNLSNNNNTSSNINSKNTTSSSGNASDKSTSNTNNLNVDIETILKMKSIIDNINQKDDPRANLLYSLKPYLRESRKNKLDEYVRLLNITKIAEAMNNNNKGNGINGFK